MSNSHAPIIRHLVGYYKEKYSDVPVPVFTKAIFDTLGISGEGLESTKLAALNGCFYKWKKGLNLDASLEYTIIAARFLLKEVFPAEYVQYDLKPEASGWIKAWKEHFVFESESDKPNIGKVDNLQGPKLTLIDSESGFDPIIEKNILDNERLLHPTVISEKSHTTKSKKTWNWFSNNIDRRIWFVLFPIFLLALYFFYCFKSTASIKSNGSGTFNAYLAKISWGHGINLELDTMGGTYDDRAIIDLVTLKPNAIWATVGQINTTFLSHFGNKPILRQLNGKHLVEFFVAFDTITLVTSKDNGPEFKQISIDSLRAICATRPDNCPVLNIFEVSGTQSLIREKLGITIPSIQSATTFYTLDQIPKVLLQNPKAMAFIHKGLLAKGFTNRLVTISIIDDEGVEIKPIVNGYFIYVLADEYWQLKPDVTIFLEKLFDKDVQRQLSALGLKTDSALANQQLNELKNKYINKEDVRILRTEYPHGIEIFRSPFKSN